MFKSYLLVALRNIRKNNGYTLLNVSGLAVSLAVAALIILYMQRERSYDRWIPGEADVYRVYRQWGTSEGGSSWTPPPWPMPSGGNFRRFGKPRGCTTAAKRW